MSRKISSPEHLDLDTPGRRDYFVALEHDSLWGHHHIPLTVFVGKNAQPHQGLVAFGSTHGNEYEGPTAIKNLLAQIHIKNVTGRIILIPVLNPSAFRSGTRDSLDDDRVNLNRAFVDLAGIHPALRGITHRIARFVRDYIWPRTHVVLDLHAGGEVCRFAACVSYHPIEDLGQARIIEETARFFGTPFLLTYQNQTPGLLTSEAERLGKITLGGEFGFGRSISPAGVAYCRHGILAAAIHHRQLKGKITPFAHHADGSQKKVEIVDPACFLAAPWPAHFEPLYECGVQVKKNQPVARLHDFNRVDEAPLTLAAPHAGYIVAQANGAVVRQGQQVLTVATEARV